MTRYAIIKTRTEYVPGDERSITNPGHGYPAHTNVYQEFKEFPSVTAWEREIRYSFNNGEKIIPIVFHEAKVTTEVHITINK